MVNDYAPARDVRGHYDLNSCNTIGVYYQIKNGLPVSQRHPLQRTTTATLNVDQPQTIGIGLANRSLMGGDLLIAANVYYKLWDDAALWQDVFVNQWAFAIGAQLTRGQMQVPPGLLVQQQSHQPQRRRQPRRQPGGAGYRATLPGRHACRASTSTASPSASGARASWCRTSTWTFLPDSFPSNRASSAPVRRPRWPCTTWAWV